MAEKDSDGAELTGSEKYVVKGVTYTVHPAAALFPLVVGKEYEEGLASVREQGILHPVLHLSRQIVDGRNRLRWGLEAGVEIPMEALDPSVDVYSYVAAQNMPRPHLKAGQRATIAQGLVRLSENRRRENYDAREAARLARRHGKAAPADGGESSKPALPMHPAIGRDQAARLFNVSPTSVKRVAHTLKRAPELQPYLRDDRISIAQAAQLSRATPEQRKKVIDAVEQGNCEDFAEAIRRHAIPPLPTKGKQPSASKNGDGGAKPTAKSAGPKPDTSGAGLPALPSVGAAPVPEASKPAAAPAGDQAPAVPPADAKPADAIPPPPSASGETAEPAAAAAAPAPAAPLKAPAPAPVAPPKAPAPAPAAAAAPPVREYEPVAPAQAAIADYPPDLLSPEPVITGIRDIYGKINLDPCSTDEGQDRVRAKGWYGADQNGLSERWQGPVHVFPPGKLCRQFAAKLRAELDRDLEQATFLANFDLTERWVGDFLDHRHFSGVVVSHKLVEFDQVGQPRRYRAPQPVAVYLFGANATPEQLARAFGFWGRVLVNARER